MTTTMMMMMTMSIDVHESLTRIAPTGKRLLLSREEELLQYIDQQILQL
jgi:hypothetical protein